MPSQKYIDQTVFYGIEAMAPEVRALYRAAPVLLEALERIAPIALTVAVNEPSVRMFDWNNIHRELCAAIAQAKLGKALAPVVKT